MEWKGLKQGFIWKKASIYPKSKKRRKYGRKKSSGGILEGVGRKGNCWGVESQSCFYSYGKRHLGEKKRKKEGEKSVWGL